MKSHLCPPGTLTGEVDAASTASASFFLVPSWTSSGSGVNHVLHILSISQIGSLCTCGRWSKSSILKLNSVKFAPTIL